MNKKYLKLFLLTTFVISVLGFCIITNTSGAYRIYLPSSLPFEYRLHSTTPSSYIPVIWEAAKQWNDVEASYFAFQQGSFTSNGSLGQNGENLIFFDLQGENFQPGTSTIAFSSTWTSNSGGYHAVESDYIYNARDFTPGLNGEPGLQDLHQVSAHELGHHLGLDHTGLPGGASSGCGPLVSNAVMYAFNSGGDTTRRRLHIEDIMGLISCYPNWVIQGQVKASDTNLPIPNAEIVLDGTLGTEIGPVVNPIGNRRNRIGLIKEKLTCDASGNYISAVNEGQFNIMVDMFGFYPQTKAIQFSPPSGFGNTQFEVNDFQLQRTPIVTLNVNISDTVSNIPIPATYKLYWVNRLDSALISSETGPDGNFSESVSSAEYYRLVLNFNHPYVPEKIYDSVYVSEAGLNLEIKTRPVQNLLVLDLDNEAYRELNLQTLAGTGYEFAVWDNTQNDSTLTNQYLNKFSQPVTLIWSSDAQTQGSFDEQDRLLISQHLLNGGRLILSGRNLAEVYGTDSLISRLIGVSFTGNNALFPIRGFSGDIIGDGINFSAPGSYKDRFEISSTSASDVFKSFHYGTGLADTTKLAGIRFENNAYNYKGFFLGFGLEIVPFSSSAEMISRALAYTNDVTLPPVSVDGAVTGPDSYNLSQNYPNPFNPSTIISFTIPVREKVELVIYNTLGERVRTLINGELPAGKHHAEFNASGLSSGVYLYQFRTKGYSATKKLMLLK